MPVTSAAKQENTKSSFRIVVIWAPLARADAGGRLGAIGEWCLYKIAHCNLRQRGTLRLRLARWVDRFHFPFEEPSRKSPPARPLAAG